jgi:hypothetical protein
MEGLREHSLARWNIGPAPYGYQAEKVAHPVAVKAAQGHSKSRLIIDPQRAPVVAQIFAWRVRDKMGTPAITARLNAGLDACPPPKGTAWTVTTVSAILANPKYTGYMVFGRRRTTGGRTRYAPQAEWLWSPEPAHPAIVTRAEWDAAQAAAAGYGTARDDDGISAHPAARRTYVLRSRIRCRICRRRMSGITRSSSRYYASGPDAIDPGLLNALPMIGDILAEAPRRLQAVLYQAFSIELLYNKNMHQVTTWATITDTTPRTLAAIINDSEDPDAATTVSPPVSDLSQHPRAPTTLRDHGTGAAGAAAGSLLAWARARTGGRPAVARGDELYDGAACGRAGG